MPAGKKQADEKPEAAEESAAPAVPAPDAAAPVVEFPKYVKGYIFKSREEQDAAGPEYADEVK